MVSIENAHLNAQDAEIARAVQWIVDNPGEVVYVAGPMAGQQGHGYEEFHQAEERLWRYGLTPRSPARGAPPLTVIEEVSRQYGGDFRKSALYADMLHRDIAFILESAAVFMLPGWMHSKGVKTEMYVAEALQLAVLDGSWLLRD